MIYAILKTANAMTCFRLDWLDKACGVPGLWSEVGANFTHMHPETHTFSSLWLPWKPDEAAFLENYRDVVAREKVAVRSLRSAAFPEMRCRSR